MHKRKIKNKYIENPQGFAAGINFYKIVWVFFIGCVIGYAVEMLYAYAQKGMWINRQGLIYGPFNQIYGMGMVLCAVALYRLRNANAAVIFGISAILGSVFEYLCSFAQELAFGCVSWEYSHTPANIGGRTNLFFALCWGMLGMVFIRNFYPYMCKWVEKIPNKIGKPLTIVIAVVLSIDILISALAVARQGQRVRDVPPLTVVGELLDKYYPDEYMAKVYPSMQFR